MLTFCLLFFVPFFAFSLLSFLFLSSFLLKRHRTEVELERLTQSVNWSDPSFPKQPLPELVEKTDKPGENEPTRLSHSLLLEVLTSDSSRWTTLFAKEGRDDPNSNGSGNENRKADTTGPGLDKGQGGKKKKRKAKKKRTSSQAEQGGDEDGGNSVSSYRAKQELVCTYPFTSSGSATQRKIKRQYDELMKCSESRGLTLAQVGQFVNCLIEARNDLQHKSEIIQRKFTITKALLFKADRSSFDRLRQQIYKLELEQKRLEEDAFVYNWLQQQLKLSPAYKKMLEIGASMESKAKSDELMESTDAEFADISFEELLAQEKKDSFWKKNGRARLGSS